MGEKTKSVPSFLVNRSVVKISRQAEETMPKVTAGQMDAELNAAIAHELRKMTGTRPARMAMLAGSPRFSKNKKNQKYFFGGVSGGTYRGAGGAFPAPAQYQYEGEGFRSGAAGSLTPHSPNYNSDVPLAALIINAQANPSSNFNLITGGRYRRQASPFKGLSRAAGAQAMLDAMRRMLSARHSSGGFFALCARVVKQMFIPALSRNPVVSAAAMTGFEALPGGGSVSGRIGTIAGGTVARDVGNSARASFWVTATISDTEGKPGNAIFRVAQPVWQRAVDDEADRLYREAQETYVAAARESGFTVK